MQGYLDRPEETRAVLADGWFRTGDLVAVSPDGHVSIVGRKRELILRGGYSVVPAEVEAVLLAPPAAAQAAGAAPAAPGAGRGGRGLRPAAPGRRERTRRADRPLQGAPRRLQVPASGADRRAAPEERHGQDPKEPAQVKMLSGRNAETIQLGASTISLILRSTATLERM